MEMRQLVEYEVTTTCSHLQHGQAAAQTDSETPAISIIVTA